jgi:hypothetical protein
MVVYPGPEPEGEPVETIFFAATGDAGRSGPEPVIPPGWTLLEVLGAHRMVLQQVTDVLDQRIMALARLAQMQEAQRDDAE